MSTKPNVALARFADTGGADKTAPSSGLRDTGFVEGTPADQSIVNELLFQGYSWDQYVSDGAFQGVASFDSTLLVSGLLTLGQGTPVIMASQLVIADTVFTADNATETFAAAAHGLHTGDGPVRVANSGGALPTGLTAGTDYWVIRVSVNTFKLATSLANALAGTFLSISTNGTGTQTLSDTASTARVMLLTDGRAVRQIEPTWSTIVAHGLVPVGEANPGSYQTGTNTIFYQGDGVAGSNLYVPVKLTAGQIVTDFAATFNNPTGGGVQVALFKQKIGTATQVGAFTFNSTTGTITEFRATSSTVVSVTVPNFTAADGESYYVRITHQANTKIESVGIFATPA